MKRSIIIAVVGFVVAPAALGAQTTDSDMAGWNTYRNESGEYEFRYPDTLKLSIPTGKICTNGDCRAIEEIMLRRLDISDGKSEVRSMQLTIRRGVNSQRLPIRQWYEALAQRPLNSAETVISVGGKTAIRRGPLVPGREGMVPNNETYVPLNPMDVLDVYVSSGSAQWTELCAKVLSTLTFTK